ncbi:MAG TPA: hypothetical protein VLA19_33045 [Herpetosiphonaceae bacterium]|nr:hypothetical protein [Herpetosiphonaceae bacterium]
MTDDTAPLPAELPDPERFNLSTYVVAGQVYQRKQDAEGQRIIPALLQGGHYESRESR